MRYTIVAESTLGDLIIQVNQHIKEHWKPFGSIFTFRAPLPNAIPDGNRVYCTWYGQPMIRSAWYADPGDNNAKKNETKQETAKA